MTWVCPILCNRKNNKTANESKWIFYYKSLKRKQLGGFIKNLSVVTLEYFTGFLKVAWILDDYFRSLEAAAAEADVEVAEVVAK